MTAPHILNPAALLGRACRMRRRSCCGICTPRWSTHCNASSTKIDTWRLDTGLLALVHTRQHSNDPTDHGPLAL